VCSGSFFGIFSAATAYHTMLTSLDKGFERLSQAYMVVGFHLVPEHGNFWTHLFHFTFVSISQNISFCTIQICSLLPTPTAIAGVTFLPPFVCVSVFQYLKNDSARMIKLGTVMFHREPWKSIYSGIKRSRMRGTKQHCRRGFLHSCECSLLLVIIIIIIIIIIIEVV